MYNTISVSLDQLLLDPDNYRLYDVDGFIKVSPRRYHEKNIQDNTFSLLQKEGHEELKALKNSIETNSYVPFEILVVRPYEFQDDLFVMVEGNRRVVAMKWILRDAAAGVDVPATSLASFETITAIIVDPSKEDQKQMQNTLMGIRHVSGVKDWRGYARAKLLEEMISESSEGISAAAKRLSMTPTDAHRRYRAIKAYQQMEHDEEFGGSANPKLYSLFLEAIISTKIKRWLEWNEAEYQFTNQENLAEFYKLLISYTDDENGEPRIIEPKLRTTAHIRRIRDIVDNDEALEVLLDSDRTLEDALAILQMQKGTIWLPKVQAALKAIERLEVSQVKKLTDEEVKVLRKLQDIIVERISDWQSLTGKK